MQGGAPVAVAEMAGRAVSLLDNRNLQFIAELIKK